MVPGNSTVSGGLLLDLVRGRLTAPPAAHATGAGAEPRPAGLLQTAPRPVQRSSDSGAGTAFPATECQAQALGRRNIALLQSSELNAPDTEA